MDQKQEEFAKRLGRVARGSNQNMVVGPMRTQSVGRYQRLSAMVERNRQLTGDYGQGQAPSFKLTVVLAWALALALGVLAAFLARYLRFQVAGSPFSLRPDLELAFDILVAIFIAFLLREALSLSAVKRMGAQVAGIVLAMFTMHNVVHAMPDTFERVFSIDWVQHVMQNTEAGTFNVMGQSFTF